MRCASNDLPRSPRLRSPHARPILRSTSRRSPRRSVAARRRLGARIRRSDGARRAPASPARQAADGCAHRSDARDGRLHRRRRGTEGPRGWRQRNGRGRGRRRWRRRPRRLPGAGGGAGSADGGAAQEQPTVGSVANKKGGTLYVESSDGTTIRVKTNAQSKVTRNAASSPRGIYPGDTVVVQGTKNEDGSVVATRITATSASAAASGGGFFGGGQPPTGAPGG